MRSSLVTIVSSDMREWKPPVLADIIVSELLGSFGDNELSPECLDGAQHLLKPGAISIPTSYTSYLAPVTSAKLYNALASCVDPLKPTEAPYETPYVVYLHNVYLPSACKELASVHIPTPQLGVKLQRTLHSALIQILSELYYTRVCWVLQQRSI